MAKKHTLDYTTSLKAKAICTYIMYVSKINSPPKDACKLVITLSLDSFERALEFHHQGKYLRFTQN